MSDAANTDSRPDRRTVLKGGAAALVALGAPAAPLAAGSPQPVAGAVFAARPILFAVAAPAAPSPAGA